MDELKHYYGALIIVSHNRYLLDRLVMKLRELDNGKLREFSGTYSDDVQHFPRHGTMDDSPIDYL